MSPWPARDAELRAMYPDMDNAEIGERMGLTKRSVDMRACRLKLSKSPTYSKKLATERGNAARDVLAGRQAHRTAKPQSERLEPLAWIASQLTGRRKKTKHEVAAQAQTKVSVDDLVAFIRSKDYVTYDVLVERFGIGRTTAIRVTKKAIALRLVVRHKGELVRGAYRPDTFTEA